MHSRFTKVLGLIHWLVGHRVISRSFILPPCLSSCFFNHLSLIFLSPSVFLPVFYSLSSLSLLLHTLTISLLFCLSLHTLASFFPFICLSLSLSVCLYLCLTHYAVLDSSCQLAQRAIHHSYPTIRLHPSLLGPSPNQNSPLGNILLLLHRNWHYCWYLPPSSPKEPYHQLIPTLL